MARDKSWINPCGFEKDESDTCSIGITNTTSLSDSVLRCGDIILRRIKELQKIMSEEFPEIDKDSLLSQEYDFLKLKEENDMRYVEAYSTLQRCTMAIEDLLLRNQERQTDYFEKLQKLREKMVEFLCCVNIILKRKCLKFKNEKENSMSKPFILAGEQNKFERHFIAIRQIESNIIYILKKLKEIS